MFYNMEASIIITGFWGPLYYNSKKEPPKQYWQLFRPLFYIGGSGCVCPCLQGLGCRPSRFKVQGYRRVFVGVLHGFCRSCRGVLRRIELLHCEGFVPSFGFSGEVYLFKLQSNETLTSTQPETLKHKPTLIATSFRDDDAQWSCGSCMKS